MADGNGIYVSGTGAGNLVRYNYIHDCASEHMGEAIRCDDDQHDTVIHGNIITRMGGLATYVAIKGINHVTNNIFAFPLAPPGRGMLSLECAPVNGSRIQRNIFLTDRKGDRIVYQGLNYYNNTATLADCITDNNLYWNTADPNWGGRHIARERKAGSETGSLSRDPLFADARADDFRLKPGSPLRNQGFEPLDAVIIGSRGRRSRKHINGFPGQLR
jgi:hypothetical protein